MKRQFNVGAGNEQLSDDDTTTQVQVGWWPVWATIFCVAIIVGLLVFIGCTKHHDHPIIPEHPQHAEHPGYPPTEYVSLSGFWNIQVKHTTSAGDHYELRQMIEDKFITIWEHTFDDAGTGKFVSFKIPGAYHPSNPIGFLVKKSRAEMFAWFEVAEMPGLLWLNGLLYSEILDKT